MPPDHVLATGDERTALHGAFPDSPGIVLISGTGMICIGCNARREEARSGGWGWLLDGAGGAFDLGHQGLQLSLRMADGRLPDHPLRQRLWHAMNCHSSAQVKAMVVNPDFGAAGFAALAPLVVTAAEEGLVEASHILRRSAHALTECVITVGGRLELAAPQLAARGGAIEHLHGYRRMIEEVLSHQLPQARWSAASGDACDGALTLARDLRQR
jgi:N-acetylglucosamine kinase-like BadF-type ATPase